jgi:hypothetical protein
VQSEIDAAVTEYLQNATSRESAAG